MSYINAHANAVIAHLFGGGALAQPTAWYISLFTTMPAADGTGGVEVSDGGYSRENNTAWTLDTANRQAQNTNELNFGSAVGTIPTILGFGIYTLGTGGVLREIGLFTNQQGVSAGQEITIAALGAYSRLPV